jgi:spore maturation protein CgeB
MKRRLRALLDDPEKARALAARGRRTVLERHTCAHRVDELLALCNEIEVPAARRAAPALRATA